MNSMTVHEVMCQNSSRYGAMGSRGAKMLEVSAVGTRRGFNLCVVPSYRNRGVLEFLRVGSPE